ncbi:hypothetical protein ACX3T3_03880 [Actinotignum schaalii]|uniref:hypothetical protein n=1 Tax=Actinotignum TaxID=1653174 RepID=UPI00237DD3C9|nr:hypothetical protein [Actinotignum sanguinis]MDE1552246.1 hypothetical protein [Actinotignum sanguinis]
MTHRTRDLVKEISQRLRDRLEKTIDYYQQLAEKYEEKCNEACWAGEYYHVFNILRAEYQGRAFQAKDTLHYLDEALKSLPSGHVPQPRATHEKKGE